MRNCSLFALVFNAANLREAYDVALSRPREKGFPIATYNYTPRDLRRVESCSKTKAVTRHPRPMASGDKATSCRDTMTGEKTRQLVFIRHGPGHSVYYIICGPSNCEASERLTNTGPNPAIDITLPT